MYISTAVLVMNQVCLVFFTICFKMASPSLTAPETAHNATLQIPDIVIAENTQKMVPKS